MLRYYFGFICGAYSLYLCADLPSIGLLVAIGAAALLALLGRATRVLAAFLIGFVFMGIAATIAIGKRLPPDPDRGTLAADFAVIDFPQQQNASVRLLVEPLDNTTLPRRIRLSWHEPSILPRIGETWHLRVRLRPPRGFANSGLFDYEGWLFQHGIGATGYVVPSSKNRELLEHAEQPIPKLRGRLAERLLRTLPADEASAVLLALTVGSRHLLGPEQWQQFARTGTSHLMAISGLHIGLAAGGAFVLSQILLLPWARRINVRDWAGSVALCAALGYVLISGLAIPARRAAVMLVLVWGALICRLEARAERILLLTALLTCLMDPLSIFSGSYMLSFAAVLTLVWTAKRSLAPVAENMGIAVRMMRGGKRLVVLQVLLLLGLLPVAAALFGQVSAAAPAVNTLMLPIFSFLVVPAALLGLVLGGALSAVGDMLLWIAYYATRAALVVVAEAATWPLAALKTAALRWHLIPIALLSVTWVMLPPGFLGRAIAWPAALFLVFYKPATPMPSCFNVHVLDVGQGFAALVQTSNSTLLYDAGPRFMSGADTGTLVVVPYLESLGIRELDTLVISHGDLDHSGGSAAVVERFPNSTLAVGELRNAPAKQAELCVAGQRWTWDGVEFRFLQPAAQNRGEGNDSSCVMRVSAGANSVLFTGDIERPVERQLLREGLLEGATVAMVPHHGSRTSSGADFVASLRPQLAVVSSGYLNRWGFPKADVVGRWQAVGAEVLNTADSGAITFSLCADGEVTDIGRARLDQRKFWNQKD